MKSKRVAAMHAIIVAAAMAGQAHAAAAARPITGKWLTDNAEAVVEIAPCGKFLCGKVVKVLKPKPGEKSTVGTVILTELAASGSLWKGKILDPRSGKIYSAKVTANPDGTLKVEGCVAFLCKGPTWQPTT
jgi:uncharacterized protein (DUF2147 family)